MQPMLHVLEAEICLRPGERCSVQQTFLECSVHMGHRAREENYGKLRQETGQTQKLHEQWCDTWAKTVRGGEEKEKGGNMVRMSAPLLPVVLLIVYIGWFLGNCV